MQSRRASDTPTDPSAGRLDAVRHSLRRFFVRPTVEILIGILILASVALTLVELSLPADARSLGVVMQINVWITIVFAIELALRFVAESAGKRRIRRFLRRWWIDLLAVVPPLILIADPWRLLRGLRVLRYFRLLRLGRLFTGVGNLLPYVLRRGAAHLGLVLLALFMTVIVGTSLILSFEVQANPDISSFGEAFWFSLFSLFAGEPIPGPLTTLEGRVASVVVIFMGLSVFAAFTGTVSAFMIERLQREEASMDKIQALDDHIILCGLGEVGFRVLQVLNRLERKVLAVEMDGDSEFVAHARDMKVPLLIADVRAPNVLTDAGLQHARAVIACTDDDLTNLEIAIDARHIRPEIRIVLRLFDDRLADKIREGFKIQVVFNASQLAAPSFAAAAIDRSVMGSLEVDDRVFIHSEFRVPPQSALAGKKVGDIVRDYEVHTLRTRNEQDGDHWSPPHHHRIPGDATIVVVGPFDRVEELKKVCGISQDLVVATHGEEVER